MLCIWHCMIGDHCDVEYKLARSNKKTSIAKRVHWSTLYHVVIEPRIQDGQDEYESTSIKSKFGGLFKCTLQKYGNILVL